MESCEKGEGKVLLRYRVRNKLLLQRNQPDSQHHVSYWHLWPGSQSRKKWAGEE